MISLGFVKRSALMAILAGQPRKAVVAKEETRTRNVKVFAMDSLEGSMTGVMLEVLAERKRATDRGVRDSEIDDLYTSKQLIHGAEAYCMTARGARATTAALIKWPWPEHTFRPKNPRGDLIKAIHLLVSEVERLDRANSLQSPPAI